MTNVPQFYASRLLIGLFESGMYPALAITLTYVVRLFLWRLSFAESAQNILYPRGTSS